MLQGLTVLSPDGNLFFSRPSIVRSCEEYEARSEGVAADWVILALKSTSFHEVSVAPSQFKCHYWNCIMGSYGLKPSVCSHYLFCTGASTTGKGLDRP